MTGREPGAGGLHRRWLPAFLVGMAAAAAAEVAAALLLYSGPGLVRALTLVLAAELVGLAFGFWSAPPPPGPSAPAPPSGPPPSPPSGPPSPPPSGPPSSPTSSPRRTRSDRRPPDFLLAVRRRWLFALVAFSAAAGFAGAWPIVARDGMTALGQGLGLALLGALPLYGAGAVLGSLSAGSDRPGRVAVSGTFGAAAGVLITGLLLTRVLRPVTLLLLCVAVLAAGALLDVPTEESDAGKEGRVPDPEPDPGTGKEHHLPDTGAAG